MRKNQEIEVKLQIKNCAQTDKILAWLKSQAQENLQVIQMKAVYYDTAEGFFNAHRIAYSVRQ